MVNVRKYGAGVITGLVSLGQGTCYYPDCQEPLVRFVDGTPVNNFETAHICAISPTGPRYDEKMDDVRVNSIDNLVLLCLVHHKVVDKLRPDDFPTATLRDWKASREAAGYAALRGLRELTEERLQELMSEAFETFTEQLSDAMSKLEAMDLEAANLLRPLIDELAEARLGAQFPSEDTAGMLADAADKLANLQDTASTLAEAAEGLAGLEDVAATLSQAARDLKDGQQFM